MSGMGELSRRLAERRARLLREALEAAEALLEALERRGIHVEAAYLFGSRVRGDALRSSDVDLVVVSPSFRGMRPIDRLELVYQVEWEEGITPWVEVIALTPEELLERLRRPGVVRDASRYWLRLR